VPGNEIDPRDQEQLDRIRASTLRLGEFIWDLSEAYARLDPAGRPLDADEREEAGELAERAAVVWRDAEETYATDPRIERELGSKRWNDFVGAVLDSLILSQSSDPDRRRMALSRDELAARGQEVAEDWTTTPHERHLREPLDRRQLDASDADAFDQLTVRMQRVLAEAVDFYIELAKTEGRVHGAGEAEAAELLERVSEIGLELDRRHRLVASFAERADLAPMIRFLRSMHVGLVLRLSSDRGRRGRAIPIDEWGSRSQLVHEALTRATPGEG
jgi:hypothetical protein